MSVLFLFQIINYEPFKIKKMKTKVLFTLALSALLSLTSFGQEKEERFGFELSGGPSLATREIDESKLEKGLGFEGIFHYRFMLHTGVYAGPSPDISQQIAP
jgi:hypothetical protein